MTKRQRNWVMASLLLASIMSGLDATIINTALPAIISDLHGIQYMGWIVAVFLLGMAVFSPLWGKLGDRIGNKKAFGLSILIFIVSSMIEGTAGNIWVFIIARTFMGIGAGGMGSIPYIILAQLYRNIHRRSQGLAYISAAWSGATIIGPLVGGWIVDTLSWHWVFYINLPIGIITILILNVFFKEQVEVVRTPFDYRGSVFLIIGLAFALMGIQLLGMVAWEWIVGLLLIGGVLLILFWKNEQRVNDPIIPTHLFKFSKLVKDLVIFALAWGGTISFSIYAPMWAQGLLAMTALVGGMTQIPGSIFDFVGSQLTHSFRRKIGDQNTITLALVIAFLAPLGMLCSKVNAGIGWICFFSIFYGFGVGVIFNILQIKVQQDVDHRDVGIATSVSYLIRILAQTFMSSIYGVIMNMALARGVRPTHGKITVAMMDKLSDSATVHELPAHLLPQMRMILHSGLQDIMLVSCGLLVIAIGYNLLKKTD